MLVGFTNGLIWSVPLYLAYGVAPHVPILLVLGLGIVVIAVVGYAIFHWTASVQWRRQDGFPLVLGALLASMLSGFLILYGSQASAVDYAGKIVVNVVVMTLVAWLWRRELH